MNFANFGFILTKSLEMPLYKGILVSEVWVRYLTYTSLVPHSYLTYASLAFVLHVKIMEYEAHFLRLFCRMLVRLSLCTFASFQQPLDCLTGVR